MTKVKDIMTRRVISVSPNLSIRDAMSLLTSRHISGVPVVVGTEIVGVVTSNDLMALVAELPSESAGRPFQLELEPPTPADQDHSGMETEAPGAFFMDLCKDAGAEIVMRFTKATGAECNALDEHTVQEAMTRPPICSVPADTTLPDAAEFMRLRGIHRVLVTDTGRFVGIATSTDIANAVAAFKVEE